MIDMQTKAELERLQTNFIYAADRRDYAAIQHLYHPDAIDDHGGFKGDVNGYVEWLKVVQNSFIMSSHVLTNMRFAVDGDYAESEVRGTTYLRMQAEKPFNVMVVGRHFDTYERRSHAWKFLHRSLCVDWVQVFPGDEATIDVVGPISRGTMGKDDPSYARLRLLDKFV